MIATVNINKFLQSKGFKTVGEDWHKKQLDDWAYWYRGDTDRFHKYTITNTGNTKTHYRLTLNMAKKVCEDKADSLLNENVVITTGNIDSAEDKLIKQVLRDNKFRVNGNQLIEGVAYTGTGAFIEYKSKDKVSIDFVTGDCIYPLAWSKKGITQCAFASETTAGTYIAIHTFPIGKDGKRKTDGNYIVVNFLLKQEEGQEEPTELPLPDGMQETWETKTDIPMFQIIKMNIANNIDAGNPMGISVFANSIDVLKGIDTIYDSYINEFILGKKRIMVSASAIKRPDIGAAPVFDPNDTAYYDAGEDKDGNPIPVKEIDFSLRCDEHEKALQNILDLLSDKTGFGKGHFRFDPIMSKTATEVVSRDDDKQVKINKDKIVINAAMTDMVKAILFLSGKKTDVQISIDENDSVIESTETIINRALLERNAGVTDDVMYFMETRNLDKEAAIALVKERDARQTVEHMEDDE